jgi:TonB family protein
MVAGGEQGQRGRMQAMATADTEAGGVPPFVFEKRRANEEPPTRERRMLEVVSLWGEVPLAIAHYRSPKLVTIGEGNNCDFHSGGALADGERFVLVEAEQGGLVVNCTDAMPLEVQGEGGSVLDREALAAQHQLERRPGGQWQYRLGLHDAVALRVGKLTFTARYVAPAPALPRPFGKGLDVSFFKRLALSFVAAAFVVLALVLTPAEPGGAADDLFVSSNRVVRLVAREEKKPDKPKLDLDKAALAKRKEKPKPDLTAKSVALPTTKGAPRVNTAQREQDRKIVQQSGIFKILKQQGRATSGVFGPGGLGDDLSEAVGGMRGRGLGDAGGATGLGSRGPGPGGGGGALGIGGLGRGGGFGDGQGGGGGGDAALAGRKGTYQPGNAVAKGCLSSEVVMRQLGRVESQARFCYEKELMGHPELEGKITTRFIVGPTGEVQSVTITESTMQNPSVESCLQRIVQRLRFPPCAGGGVAEVTYPWIFKSGGRQP